MRFLYIRPSEKGSELKIILLISQLKHMLCVLIRTVSIRQFCSVPITYVVGIQKSRLNETVLLSTQTCLNFTILLRNFV